MYKKHIVLYKPERFWYNRKENIVKPEKRFYHAY